MIALPPAGFIFPAVRTFLFGLFPYLVANVGRSWEESNESS